MAIEMASADATIADLMIELLCFLFDTVATSALRPPFPLRSEFG
jgi:hypothetical protein